MEWGKDPISQMDMVEMPPNEPAKCSSSASQEVLFHLADY